MKIYQRLEQLLKFRIYSNSEIGEYLTKLSNMGKLDEVRKQALIVLILNKLGEIEDKEEQEKISKEYVENRLDAVDIKVVDKPIYVPLAGNGQDGNLTIKEDGTEAVIFKCPDCDMVAKSKLGLNSHFRNKHKKS